MDDAERIRRLTDTRLEDYIRRTEPDTIGKVLCSFFRKRSWRRYDIAVTESERRHTEQFKKTLAQKQSTVDILPGAMYQGIQIQSAYEPNE